MKYLEWKAPNHNLYLFHCNAVMSPSIEMFALSLFEDVKVVLLDLRWNHT